MGRSLGSARVFKDKLKVRQKKTGPRDSGTGLLSTTDRDNHPVGSS